MTKTTLYIVLAFIALIICFMPIGTTRLILKEIIKEKIDTPHVEPTECSVTDSLYNSVIDHIKSCEGFRSTPYKDTNGALTIGYGHCIKEGEKYIKVNKAIAEKLLVEDLTRCVNHIEKITDLCGRQSLAMGMLAFNCGTSKVSGYINRGLLDNIEALPRYCHYTNSKGITVKSTGLLKRRTFELKVYTNEI
jgi:GH24 family phage-related lysozyme (muramidase)|tara:strand:+ start:1834 stop:2409 length:576 start_codon:yes stop_codon:yes gene_type:complete